MSEEGVALHLDFSKVSHDEDNSDPVPLAVAIKLRFANGNEHMITIQLLHTKFRGKAP